MRPRAGGLEVFQLPEVPAAVQPIVKILPVQLLSLAFAARWIRSWPLRAHFENY